MATKIGARRELSGSSEDYQNTIAEQEHQNRNVCLLRIEYLRTVNKPKSAQE